MNIALIGYGKMGRTIEAVAQSRGHRIVLCVDTSENALDLTGVDVAFEFTTPTVAFSNVSACIEQGVAVVCGTTGWLEHYPKAVALCEQKGGALLCASNFSIGVNLFFALNEIFAQMIAPFTQYRVSFTEVHHTQKLDRPSGTALTLRQGVAKAIEGATHTEIVSVREGDVPGVHQVQYDSPEDQIQFIHTAHSRQGFALGAVLAGEWLYGKQGVFSMEDVLKTTLKAYK